MDLTLLNLNLKIKGFFKKQKQTFWEKILKKMKKRARMTTMTELSFLNQISILK